MTAASPRAAGVPPLLSPVLWTWIGRLALVAGGLVILLFPLSPSRSAQTQTS